MAGALGSELSSSLPELLSCSMSDSTSSPSDYLNNGDDLPMANMYKENNVSNIGDGPVNSYFAVYHTGE